MKHRQKLRYQQLEVTHLLNQRYQRVRVKHLLNQRHQRVRVKHLLNQRHQRVKTKHLLNRRHQRVKIKHLLNQRHQQLEVTHLLNPMCQQRLKKQPRPKFPPNWKPLKNPGNILPRNCMRLMAAMGNTGNITMQKVMLLSRRKTEGLHFSVQEVFLVSLW